MSMFEIICGLLLCLFALMGVMRLWEAGKNSGGILGKLGMFSWTIHRVFAHPVSEVLYILGSITGVGAVKSFSRWIHRVTMPSSLGPVAHDRFVMRVPVPATQVVVVPAAQQQVVVAEPAPPAQGPRIRRDTVPMDAPPVMEASS